MGNPAYDARREAEQAEAEKNKAAEEAGKAALDTFIALMTGHAYVQISKGLMGETLISIGRR